MRASTIVLFLVLRQMTGELWPSAFVARAVRHSSSARRIGGLGVPSGRTCLSGLFFMLTLAAYVGYACRPFSLAPLPVGRSRCSRWA